MLFDRVRNQLDAADLAWLGEWDHRQVWADDGNLAGGSWLADRTRMEPSTARERVRVASKLRRMPVAAEAFAAGRLSYSHARELAKAVSDATLEAYLACEAALVEAAQSLRPKDVKRLVDAFLEHATGEEPSPEPFEPKVFLAETFEGTWDLHGTLGGEDGHTVDGALDALIKRQLKAESDACASPEPKPTWAQRRARALVDMARITLEHLDCDRNRSPALPLVSAVLDYDRLIAGKPQASALSGGQPLTGDALQRLLCDCDIARVILHGDSRVLDLGQTTQVVPRELRNALSVRDGGCAFPGCGHKPRWCHAHHIIHWVDKGPTAIHNLVLLCPKHHRLVHAKDTTKRITLRGNPHHGTLTFHRPDGTQIRSWTDALTDEHLDIALAS